MAETAQPGPMSAHAPEGGTRRDFLSIAATASIAAFGTLEAISPRLGLDQWALVHLTSDAEYRDFLIRRGQPPPSDEEVAARRKREYEGTLRGIQFEASRRALGSAFVLVLSAFIFVVHWRLARRFQPVEPTAA